MSISVYRSKPDASDPLGLQLVGRLESDGSFACDGRYVHDPNAAPLSLSLP